MDFTRPPRCLKLPKCHKLHTRARWSTMCPQDTFAFSFFSHFFVFHSPRYSFLLVALSSSSHFLPSRTFFQVALSSLSPLPPSCSLLLGAPSSSSLLPMFFFFQERHFIKFDESITDGQMDGRTDDRTNEQMERLADGRMDGRTDGEAEK